MATKSSWWDKFLKIVIAVASAVLGGMNSIVAYMLANVVNFRCIGESLFYGLEQYMGSYYSFLMTLWNIGAVYVIIWFMYKRGIFLKV